MKYYINYILNGGSVNANIIWNNKNHIVLDGYNANKKKKYNINYNKFYSCELSIDPFKCKELEQKPSRIDLYGDSKVDLSWLKFGRNGMTNCGLTCYFNSFMQCILFTYPLIYHLKLLEDIKLSYDNKIMFKLKNKKKLSDDEKNLINNKRLLITTFNDLINEKFNESNATIDMINFFDTFSKLELMGPLGEYQDSQEYFMMFIDSMISAYPKIDGYEINLFEYYFKFKIKNIMRKKNKYTGEIMPETSSYNDMTHLNLQIIDDDNKNINNLNSCLLDFFKEETYQNENRRIPGNSNLEWDTKNIIMLNVPKILVIHLKRFKFKEGLKYDIKKGVYKDKENNVVDPIEFIGHEVDMPYKLDEEFEIYFPNSKITYDLYAFSYYIERSKHYISFIKKPFFIEPNLEYNNINFTPGWYLVNDDIQFDFLDDDEVNQYKNNGYLYFYKARDFNVNGQSFHHLGNEDIFFTYDF